MARKKGNRELRRKILIVCEGYTEVHYLNFLKNKFKSSNVTVIPCKSKKTNAYGIVHSTITHSEFKSCYKAYVFFDKDENKPEDIMRALKLANEYGITVAFSNISFDLWVLLHFRSVNSYMTQPNICKELTKYFRCSDYSREYKNNDQIGAVLFPRLFAPFKNISLMANYNQPIESSLQTNPYQNVHRIIDEVFDIKKHEMKYQ